MKKLKFKSFFDEPPEPNNRKYFCLYRFDASEEGIAFQDIDIHFFLFGKFRMEGDTGFSFFSFLKQKDDFCESYRRSLFGFQRHYQTLIIELFFLRFSIN